mmetsp:Transcript_61872/g.96068  ORF Transcript_61872/g.96068 Transcript_61872/m.96068 type:complete len:276 (+) Transcript_61872:801-1628(+)
MVWASNGVFFSIWCPHAANMSVLISRCVDLSVCGLTCTSIPEISTTKGSPFALCLCRARINTASLISPEFIVITAQPIPLCFFTLQEMPSASKGCLVTSWSRFLAISDSSSETVLALPGLPPPFPLPPLPTPSNPPLPLPPFLLAVSSSFWRRWYASSFALPFDLPAFPSFCLPLAWVTASELPLLAYSLGLLSRLLSHDRSSLLSPFHPSATVESCLLLPLPFSRSPFGRAASFFGGVVGGSSTTFSFQTMRVCCGMVEEVFSSKKASQPQQAT